MRWAVCLLVLVGCTRHNADQAADLAVVLDLGDDFAGGVDAADTDSGEDGGDDAGTNDDLATDDAGPDLANAPDLATAPDLAPPGPVCGDSHIDTAIGEQCDDHNTLRMDGCDSNCRIEESVRINKFELLAGNEGCTNLDGDPDIDNSLGAGLASGAITILNGYVASPINNGSTNHLIYFVDLDDLPGQNDAMIRLGFLDGDVNTGGFTGMKGEAFAVHAADLDANRLPLSLLQPGQIASGSLTAGLGAAPLALSVFGSTANLVVRRASATVVPAGSRIDTLGPARLCGTITAGDLDKMPTPAEIDAVCSKYSNGSLLDLLVGGCSFLGITVTATQPDQDVGGDGLGSLADTNNDGIVDQCTDGTGTVITGTDCAQDARFDDAYSFAANIEALRVVIARVK